MRRWRCGFRGRAARPARTLRSCSCMAAARWSPPCWRRSGGSRGCGRRKPGEFTRRAFENGRLDLTAVEGLADLIDAETRGAAPAGVRPAQRLARRPGGDLAHAVDRGLGAGRGGHRFFRRGRRAGGSVRAGARDRARELRGRDARCAGRGGARRAAARRSGGRDRRAAQCRQIDLAQPHRAARRRDRVAASPGPRAT